MDVYPYFILFFIITSVIQEAHQAASSGSTKGETENAGSLSPKDPDVCRVQVECSKGSPSSALFDRLPDEKKTNGIPVTPGVNGPKGEQGIQGVSGLNGAKGEQGTQGTPGVNGAKGEQGIQGVPGLHGEKGKQGIQGVPGLHGEKGKQGIQGVPGLNGEKGEQGIQGVPGLNGEKGEQGIQGVPGLHGEKGEQGIQGMPGLNGISGEPGIQGIPGLMGTKGEQGIQGIAGATGPKGEQGIQGIPGLNVTKGGEGLKGERGEKGTDCTLDSIGPLEKEHSSRGGLGKSLENPAKSCRDLIIDGEIPSDSESCYVYENDPFQVTCDFKNKRTCLKLNVLADADLGKMVTIDHERKSQEYLLTENPFNITNFYGINYRQLRWFQLQAKSKITQVIKFHCLNMVVKSSNEANNLRLLSWNQRYIDIKGTEDNTFSYKILSSPDECEEFERGAASEAKYNEIQLEGFPEYLPILGFTIRHIQLDKKQSFGMETVLLCADY